MARRGELQKLALRDDVAWQMKVSPHGKNLIRSNDKVATFTGAVGAERPVGSAGVKELYDDSGALRGYAVYVKTQATSLGGASWYWYERIGDYHRGRWAGRHRAGQEHLRRMPRGGRVGRPAFLDRVERLRLRANLELRPAAQTHRQRGAGRRARGPSPCSRSS